MSLPSLCQVFATSVISSSVLVFSQVLCIFPSPSFVAGAAAAGPLLHFSSPTGRSPFPVRARRLEVRARSLAFSLWTTDFQWRSCSARDHACRISCLDHRLGPCSEKRAFACSPCVCASPLFHMRSRHPVICCQSHQATLRAPLREQSRVHFRRRRCSVVVALCVITYQPTNQPTSNHATPLACFHARGSTCSFVRTGGCCPVFCW